MKKLNLIGHLVLVDVQKTTELYKSLPLVSDSNFYKKDQEKGET